MPSRDSAHRPIHGSRRHAFVRLFLPWLAGLLVAPGAPAQANRLQVSPTLIEVTAGRPAEAIWLVNPGQAAVPIQVRVFRWDQREGQDRLDPTDALIVSPSQAVIAPGQRQLIRILRQGEAPEAETSYRILVDELAGLRQAVEPAHEPAKGLQFRLRYSIPVFVMPKPGPVDAALSLSVALRRDASTRAMALEIDNEGQARARLAEALFLAPGKAPIELSPGLLGYVLPGRSMRWPLETQVAAPLEAAGMTTDAGASKRLELKVRVNGETSSRLIPIRVIDAH